MMDRSLITKDNSKIIEVISVSGKKGTDMIYLEYEDTMGGLTKMELCPVSANGLRIAIGSLQKIPKLVLPINKEGEYLSHFLLIKYISDGITMFHKEDQKSEPLGKYTDIEDGMVVFNKDDVLWIAFSVKNAICNNLDGPKKYFVISFPEKEPLEKFKEFLDKKLFPFERFGKTNKLSYGYFHTIKEV